MLRESGLNPDSDISVKRLPNHSAAVNDVIAGDVAAVIVSDRVLMQMPNTVREKVRIIHQSPNAVAPRVFYLANQALPAERGALHSQTIQQFVKDTPQGRDFITKLGYDGLIPATVQDLMPLAKYGTQFKTVLKQ